MYEAAVYYFNNFDYFNTIKNSILDEKIRIYKLLKILISQRDFYSMYALGYSYYSGDEGVIEQNYRKAYYWLNKALKIIPDDCNEHLSSIHNTFGYMYYYGYTGRPNYKKSYYHFNIASELNNASSMYKIGDLYRKGYFLEKNLEKAFFWYKKSYDCAQADDYYVNASALFRIGRAYFHGEGIKKSTKLAYKNLNKSKEHFKIFIKDKESSNYKWYATESFKQVNYLLKILKKQYK